MKFKFKSYFKKVSIIAKESITWSILFCFLISFLSVMLTFGGPGQTGLGVNVLDAVFYGDEVGRSIIDGTDSFEERISTGGFTDEYRGAVIFFLIKALFSLILINVFIYGIFILSETLQWNSFSVKNPFKTKLSLKGFWLRVRLNLVILFLLLAVTIVTLVIFVGLQYFQVIVFLRVFLIWFSKFFIFGVVLASMHMVLLMNCIAIKKKTIKAIFREYFNFSWTNIFLLAPIYVFVTLALILFSKLGVFIYVAFPSTYGLVLVLSVVIPWVLLRQLLYSYWKLTRK